MMRLYYSIGVNITGQNILAALARISYPSCASLDTLFLFPGSHSLFVGYHLY